MRVKRARIPEAATSKVYGRILLGQKSEDTLEILERVVERLKGYYMICLVIIPSGRGRLVFDVVTWWVDRGWRAFLNLLPNVDL